MKKYFLTGLVTLLPLAVTVWIARFLINFLTKPFLGLITQLTDSWPLPHPIIRFISQLFILIALFLFTLILGFVARWFFFKSLLKLSDRILDKIPLVKTVYKTTKEIIRSLFASEQKTFQQVVMVPFPYHKAYLLGLIARDAPHSCNKRQQGDMVTIFLPTGPNPTTGYLILRPKNELISLNMKPEEALKFIVSCGVVVPQKVS